MLTTWIEETIKAFTRLFPADSYLSYSYCVNGLLAVILVCLICGAVGSLVIGKQMAFFGEALAHSAFTGVTLGLLAGVGIGALRDGDFYHYGIPCIMVCFGVLIGLGIGWVREKTTLPADTVIGVFLAGAVGFGAMLFRTLRIWGFFNPENFIIADPMSVTAADLLILLVLLIACAGLLLTLYNQIVFASFNPSLARSRNIPLKLCNFSFIVMLALIINLGLRAVGALLINALLIVPAATAANLSRNMRQVFWTTIVLSLSMGILGSYLSWAVRIHVGQRDPLAFGAAGLIVVLNVIAFFLSMLVGPWLRGHQAR